MTASLLLSILASFLLAAPQQVTPGGSLSPAGGRASPSAGSLGWTVHKPSNTGIPGDNTYDIYIDAQDRPWIPGFITFWEEGGMARWDETSNTWLTVSNVDVPQIASPRFNDIEADADGVLWIATDAGLLRYDPSEPPLQMVRYDEANTPMPASKIVQACFAPDGSLWLAVRDWSASVPGGLVRHDPSAGTWEVWTTANGLPWAEQWPGWDWIDYVTTAPDDDGGYTVYFGSMEMGAASYKDGVFRSFVSDPPLSGPVIWGVPGDDTVDDIGNCWLSTDLGVAVRTPDGAITPAVLPPGGSGRVEAFSGGRAGMISFNGDVWVFDGSWTAYGNWGSNSGYALAETSTGELWASGSTGAARWSNGGWQRYRLTNTGMLGYWVESIDFDDDGNVYMNGNAGPGVGGFTIFDGQRWTCVNDFNYGLGPVWGQLSDDVDVLCVRSDGNLALDVGVGGLQQWDGESYSPINPTWITFGLEEDGLGRLWSGNWGKLFVYGDGGMVQFNELNSPMLGFEVESIVADDKLPGFVWATTGLGVVHTDGLVWTVYPRELLGLTQWSTGYFPTAAAPAADGTLWIGTGRGLYHLDTGTLTYERYTPDDTALPSDEIDHVIVTPDGSVWVTTFDSTWPYPGGLTRFDGETWTTWTMTDSPLPHNQVWDLTWRPVNGGYEVWIGTASEGVGVVTVKSPQAGTAGPAGPVRSLP